jgi:hypothetical protein
MDLRLRHKAAVMATGWPHRWGVAVANTVIPVNGGLHR